MLTKVRSVPAPAPIAPPMKSIVSFSSLADFVVVPCVEQRGRELREPELVLRIERAAGADDHPHADDRLLVMQHRDDLQAVREASAARRAGTGTSRAGSGRGGPSTASGACADAPDAPSAQHERARARDADRLRDTRGHRLPRRRASRTASASGPGGSPA